MAGRSDWIIDGFQFGIEADANQAKNEKERIEKLEEKMDYSNPQMVCAVYKKAIDNRTFKTPVGYFFLKKLKTILEDTDIKEDIPNIPVYGVYSLRERASQVSEKVKPSEKKQKTLLEKIQSEKRISIGINIALVILVIVMFYISYTGSNPTIINYENAILNKYSEWEQELSQRESLVREKEKALLGE